MGKTRSKPLQLSEDLGGKLNGEAFLRFRDAEHATPLPACRDTIFIGRASDCDLVLSDPCVSSRHASLRRLRDATWLLRDHGSKNGTALNGVRIHAAEVGLGGQISIGDTHLEVSGDLSNHSKSPLVVGSSPATLVAIRDAKRAARTSCAVLLLGETGTGKDVFARLIHAESARSSAPFVPVNCGGIPSELIRSELFGHIKGSFSGAVRDHEGLFRQAHRGTIFLDELGELPRLQQPHLLRALESGLIRKIGGAEEELIDARIIAATNQLCGAEQVSSPLRNDLYHRVSQVTISLPPLRERVEDIPKLLEHFLQAGVAEYGPHLVPPEVLGGLRSHYWPGNIRELKNAATRAMALGDHQLRLVDFLPHGPKAAPSHPLSHCLSPQDRQSRKELADAYQRCGTIRRAAAELGIPRSTFADMCQRLGIPTSRAAKRSRP